jgi:phosphoribosylaminoimidazole-succinocarboxamide synthase
VNVAPTLPMPPATRVHSGKVRDTYDLGDGRLLMVASDRMSAFDVILPTTIPGKGIVLTQLSRFWFERTTGIAANHLTGEHVADLGWGDAITRSLEDRSMVVRVAARVPIECVVRGYLAGSGWSEYVADGSIAGHAVPAGLQRASRLPRPIFTPARKNDAGHDENITIQQLRNDVGTDLADALERTSLAVYELAAEHALSRGVILADTKFEFGFIDGELAIIDELLTPDSSRFWDSATWDPGREPDSWDKQFVRNWLLASGWDRGPPGPELPADIIAGTSQRYLEGFQRITGQPLAGWLESAHAKEIS